MFFILYQRTSCMQSIEFLLISIMIIKSFYTTPVYLRRVTICKKSPIITDLSHLL